MAAQQDIPTVAVAEEQLPTQCVNVDPALMAASGDDEHLAACHFPLSSDELATVMGTGSRPNAVTGDQVSNPAMEQES